MLSIFPDSSIKIKWGPCFLKVSLIFFSGVFFLIFCIFFEFSRVVLFFQNFQCTFPNFKYFFEFFYQYEVRTLFCLFFFRNSHILPNNIFRISGVFFPNYPYFSQITKMKWGLFFLSFFSRDFPKFLKQKLSFKIFFRILLEKKRREPGSQVPVFFWLCLSVQGTLSDSTNC